MKTLLKLGKACLIGLAIAAISLSAFWALAGLQDVISPVLSKEQATYIALNYLADNNVLLDPSTARAVFSQGSWYVMFFVDPTSRPAGPMIKVNPITGKAKFAPRK